MKKPSAANNNGITNWLGQEAPRYTSYPTANHFSSSVGAESHGKWLSHLAEDTSISAYLHIPFCKELCWFCGCHTKMTKHYEPAQKYVQVLLKEIENVGQHLNGKGTLQSIHFGGGSPSFLEIDDLEAILMQLDKNFGLSDVSEFAIELDPRTTSTAKIVQYGELGCTRASIGIQDFNPIVQEAINRIQPYPMVASVVYQLKHVGIKDINCDLIYGLPHQTREGFEDTIMKTLSLDPSRISLFSYAHIPHIKKHQRLIESEWLPQEVEKLGLYMLATNILADHGYEQIGIDHFAKPDDELALALENHTMRRNFQGYVTDGADALIGFGASAISQLPEGYTQNSANTADYTARVQRGELPTVRGWQMTQDDIVRKYLIDELMCYMETDIKEVIRKFSLPADYFRMEQHEMLDKKYEGILSYENGRVRIITPYRMAARVVANIFDRYSKGSAGMHSKVA